MRRSLVVATVLLLGTSCDCGRSPVTAVPDSGTPDGGVDVDGGALADGGVAVDGGAAFTLDGGVAVSFGPDVLPAVRQRLEGHLRAVVPSLSVVPFDLDPTLANGAVHLCFGQTASAARLQLPAQVASLPAEGFVVRAEVVAGGTRALALGDARGTSFAAYALLERLGFAFLHPLAPNRPASLSAITSSLALTESPRWSRRVVHVHTQHPLELTDLLQGWGPAGPSDGAGFQAGLPRWDTYLDWLLANRQNGVEWFLLYADGWSAFADSSDRQARLKTLVDHVHAVGLQAGLDVPIVFGQQHAWRLLRNQQPSNEPAELAELDGRIDWVLGAGFDFLGSESGTSEFTAPDPQRMLDWMNELTRHAARSHVPVYMKVHASAGQTAAGFVDPQTNQPLNFNFLPHFADPSLGVLPHTLQAFGLTDPAPIYGNQDFSEVERFLGLEVGTRPVMYYPETAYWVSTDIDVPLFLPLYPQRRLADLRRLAAKEDGNQFVHPGARLDGQLIFSSGWEWGYWLHDVVTARAAWNPQTSLSDAAAFQQALAPVLSQFGAAGSDVGAWLADVASEESKLLIFGEVAGVRPSTIAQRTGMGYLVAWDTWDDVAKLTGALPATQPDKLGLVDLRNPLHGGASYTNDVAPLLDAMNTSFGALSTRAEALRARIPPQGRDLFDDLADAALVTSLRARQVKGLYAYVAGYFDLNQGPRLAALADARAALDAAAVVVAGREQRYRVPAADIASWSPNPTAYPFRYLWMVHSLYGWWRDEGKAVDAPLFPCYLNVINPVDVAFGEGMGTDAVRFLGSALSSSDQRGCLAEPASEPMYPQDMLRTRP